MTDYDRFEELRAEYEGRGLADGNGDVPTDPNVFLDLWLTEAADAGVPLSNAMAIATATTEGVPSLRMVLLKNIDESGRLWFFTDYDSHKGREIDANPNVSVMFYWQPLHRQVRATGSITRVSAADSDEYFDGRPRASQLSAAASHQSTVLAEGFGELEKARAALDAELGEAPVPRPERWGGYAIAPASFEFWQGRPDRLHHRLSFSRVGDGWTREWLAP